MPKYSMAYLTSNGASPLEAIRIAADAGFDMISFRLQFGAGPNPADELWTKSQLSDVIQALDDHGMSVLDVEMIRLDAHFKAANHERFMDMCQQLGARHVLVANDDPDRARCMDHFAALCEALAKYQLTADLEFMPFTQTKDLADCWQMVRMVNAPNAAVLFDSLHADRSGSALALLAQIPKSRLNYVQICDGFKPFDNSTEAMLHIARCAREIPGQGNIDLVSMFRHLRADFVSVEVPNERLMKSMSHLDLARQALSASKSIIEQAWGTA
jgi:sugar phosphate isomerase/epimerase